MEHVLTENDMPSTTFVYTHARELKPEHRKLFQHKCWYRLTLANGQLIAMCDCGSEFDWVEIERRINEEFAG